MERYLCVLALFLSAATVVRAQPVPQSPRSPSRFEVASVRPNKSGPGSTSMQRLPGSFTATNATLRDLILIAYGIQRYRSQGVPGWVKTNGSTSSRKQARSRLLNHLPARLSNC